jgi:hypothetical protein
VERERGEVGLIGCRAVKALVRSPAIIQQGLRTSTRHRFARSALSLASVVRDASGDSRGGLQADNVVFRRTFGGSAADRGLEVPAWMFDRARCLDPTRLTASPFVSMDALSALSDLLRQALNPPLRMRRILAHPVPLTTRIGERPMTMRSPVGPPAMLAERRRLQQGDRCQQIDLFDGGRRRRRYGRSCRRIR